MASFFKALNYDFVFAGVNHVPVPAFAGINSSRNPLLQQESIAKAGIYFEVV